MNGFSTAYIFAAKIALLLAVPAQALFETLAVAVHFQQMAVVGGSVHQSSGHRRVGRVEAVVALATGRH